MTDNDQGSPTPEPTPEPTSESNPTPEPTSPSTPTPPTVFCSKCGTEAIAGSTFCGSCGASLAPTPESPASAIGATDSESSGSGKGWIIGLLAVILLVIVGLFFFLANSDSDSGGDTEQAETSEQAEKSEVSVKVEVDTGREDSDKQSKDDGKAKDDDSSESGDAGESGGGSGDAGNRLQDFLNSIADWVSGLFGFSSFSP